MRVNLAYIIIFFVTLAVSSGQGRSRSRLPQRGNTIEGSGSGSGVLPDDEDSRAAPPPKAKAPGRRFNPLGRAPAAPSTTAVPATPRRRQPPPRRSKAYLDLRQPVRSPSDYRPPSPRDEGSGDTPDSEDGARVPHRKGSGMGLPRPVTQRGRQTTRPPPLRLPEIKRSWKCSPNSASYRPRCTSDGRYYPLQCEDQDCFCVKTDGSVMERTRTLRNDKIICTWVRTMIEIPLDRYKGRRRVDILRNVKNDAFNNLKGVPGQHIIHVKKFIAHSSRGEPDGIEIECRSIGYRSKAVLKRDLRNALTPLTSIASRLNVTMPAMQSEVRGARPPANDVDDGQRASLAGDETVSEKDGKNSKQSSYSVVDQVGDNGKSGKSRKNSQSKKVATLFEQPGIIAAISGGGIAGFFLAILLILFCIYRIRKKDEGSYALEEPKKTPVSAAVYHSAPTREYYA